ncbi:hypothetical protein LINPERHAP1_LOCUS25668, partial [Linum perenne]
GGSTGWVLWDSQSSVLHVVGTPYLGCFKTNTESDAEQVRLLLQSDATSLATRWCDSPRGSPAASFSTTHLSLFG